MGLHLPEQMTPSALEPMIIAAPVSPGQMLPRHVLLSLLDFLTSGKVLQNFPHGTFSADGDSLFQSSSCSSC
jgi:hypothetical protein